MQTKNKLKHHSEGKEKAENVGTVGGGTGELVIKRKRISETQRKQEGEGEERGSSGRQEKKIFHLN